MTVRAILLSLPEMHNPFDPGFYCSEELRDFGFAFVGENVRVAKTCKIIGLHNIEIGDHSRIDDFSTIIGSGPVRIGSRVHIHSYSQIGARGGVTLEDHAFLASGCKLFTASDDPSGFHMVGGVAPLHCVNPKVAPIHFGRHTGVFVNCTVLPGVTIHEGGVALAHSLVISSLPGWTIAAGNPAAPKRPRSRRLLTLDSLQDIA